MQRLGSSDGIAPPSQSSKGLLTATSSTDTGASTAQSSRERFDMDSRVYRVYKRRFLGLGQLVLLNIIVSWDWLSFAPISTTAAEFFDVSESSVNWLSTGFLFAFVAIAPLVIWTLDKGGPRLSILASSALVLLGNWIRYAGTRASPPRFGVVMFGQILIGLSQPFVLAAPTRYSNLWFSDQGRVSATAIASLANPLGGALGQLVSPLWATNKSQIPNMILYTSILSTIATLPAPFIPASPPSPPSSLAAAEKLDIRQALSVLPKNTTFWLILIPFAIYVGFFNATSSLLNQILSPYAFSETDAGLAGALLILIGLVSAAIISPIIDRTKKYILTIKILVPLIATSYLALTFMPATRTVAGPWTVCAILGATSFALLPCTLEYAALATHPVSPEITATVLWAMGQLLGGVFIVIMNALRGRWAGEPEGTMIRALIFQAVIAWTGVPFVIWLGRGKLKGEQGMVGS